MTQIEMDLASGRVFRDMDSIPAGSGAVLSSDDLYRYVLARRWDPDLPRLPWCLMNPSVADAMIEDPTSRKVRGFTRLDTRFGGYVIGNPWAFRTPYPSALIDAQKRGVDIVGPDNDAWLTRIFRLSSDGRVVIGWGGKLAKVGKDRIARVLELMASIGVEPWCFGTNDDGSPKHPLMTAYATPFTKWTPP